MTKKLNLLNEIKAYGLISIGLFIMALGWTAFLIPNELLGGGVTGIGTLVFWVTGIPVGVTFLAVNVILLIIGIRILGFGFGIKTIFSIIVTASLFSVLQYYIREPFVTDRFMAAIIGGIMGGAGIGLVFTQGGSTGGTDIVAMIINKYRRISHGKILLALDVVIISSSYLVFKNIETLVHGFVIMAVASYVIDLILTGNKQSVQLFIFSKKSHEIADRIGSEAKRGVTFIKGTGWYSKTDHDILMIITRRMESAHVFRIIKEVDPEAFISVNNVMGVYGQGFEAIR